MNTYKVTIFKEGLRWHEVKGVLPTGVKIWIAGFLNSNNFDQIKIKKELSL